MALIPHGPSDFKSLIPSASSSLCEKLLALPGRLATYVYRVVKWAVNDDLTASDDLKNWLSLSTSTALVAPTGITASDGSSSSSVVVSWTASAGASYYTVYRSTGSVFSGASVVGTSTTASYTDTTVVVDTVYTYWVTASSASATSSESVPDQGFAQSSGANSITITGNSTWTSSINGTVTIVMWGGGGGGGGRGRSPYGVPGAADFSGGGGGGGEYATGTIAVTIGQVLTAVVGAASPGGGQNQAGTNGVTTALSNGATLVLSAGGGVGGSSSDSGSNGGGAGGSGGSNGTAGSPSRASGTAGSAGSGASGGAGGGTTPVESGYGTGGSGASTSTSDGSAGLAGKIILSW